MTSQKGFQEYVLTKVRHNPLLISEYSVEPVSTASETLIPLWSPSLPKEQQDLLLSLDGPNTNTNTTANTLLQNTDSVKPTGEGPESPTSVVCSLLQRALVETPLKPIGGGEHLLYETVLPAFMEAAQLTHQRREAKRHLEEQKGATPVVDAQRLDTAEKDCRAVDEQYTAAKERLSAAFDKVKLIVSALESIVKEGEGESCGRPLKRGREEEVEREGGKREKKDTD